MNRLFEHPWARLVSAWLLAAVMLTAAVPKLIDPPGFAQSIFGYGLLPMALVAPLALVLPWVEGLSALGLLLAVTRRGAAAIILSLMLLFSGALAFNLARGNPVDCGCFGEGSTHRTRAQRLFDMQLALLRDAGLALLALHLLVRRKQAGR